MRACSLRTKSTRRPETTLTTTFGSRRKIARDHPRFALRLSKSGDFSGLMEHRHEDAVEDVAAAADQVHVAVRHRVERAGIDGGLFHGRGDCTSRPRSGVPDPARREDEKQEGDGRAARRTTTPSRQDVARLGQRAPPRRRRRRRAEAEKRERRLRQDRRAENVGRQSRAPAEARAAGRGRGRRRRRGAPAARAASTNGAARNLFDWARTRRAASVQPVTPIRRAAIRNDGGRNDGRRDDEDEGGKAPGRRSTTKRTPRSVAPPAQPAAAPSVAPRNERERAGEETRRRRRRASPCTRRESTSRPSSSVPSQCAAPGGWSRSVEARRRSGS